MFRRRNDVYQTSLMPCTDTVNTLTPHRQTTQNGPRREKKGWEGERGGDGWRKGRGGEPSPSPPVYIRSSGPTGDQEQAPKSGWKPLAIGPRAPLPLADTTGGPLAVGWKKAGPEPDKKRRGEKQWLINSGRCLFDGARSASLPP